MIERLAFWSIWLELPVYISQKDYAGGLHWEQLSKGIIFFGWALVQNLTPIFLGYKIDKFGYKNSILSGLIIVIIGYGVLAYVNNFYIFLFVCMIIGFGSGIFKNALMASIAEYSDNSSNSTIWPIYITLINIAALFGPAVAVTLTKISWHALFIGSAFILAINLILIGFVKFSKTNKELIKKEIKSLKYLDRKLLLFLLLMSGFTLCYMEFYEYLSNYILDWSDTRSIVKIFNLPSLFTYQSLRGLMISYEWFYSLNTIVVIIIGFILSMQKSIKYSVLKISIGMILVSMGFIFLSITKSSLALVFGIIIYSIGEIIVNSKFPQYINEIAPKGKKAAFMGLMSIPWTIGLAGGGLIGSYLFKHLSEKSYLLESYTQLNQINLESFKLKFSDIEIVNILQNQFFPGSFWLIFASLGIFFAIFLYVKFK